MRSGFSGPNRRSRNGYISSDLLQYLISCMYSSRAKCGSQFVPIETVSVFGPEL